MYAPEGSALQGAWGEHVKQLMRRAEGVRGAFKKIYDQRR